MHVGHIHTNIAIVIWGQDQVKLILPLSNFIFTIPILRGLTVYSKETTLNGQKWIGSKFGFTAKQINIVLESVQFSQDWLGEWFGFCCVRFTKIQTFSITCELRAVLLNSRVWHSRWPRIEMFSAQLRTAVCQLQWWHFSRAGQWKTLCLTAEDRAVKCIVCSAILWDKRCRREWTLFSFVAAEQRLSSWGRILCFGRKRALAVEPHGCRGVGTLLQFLWVALSPGLHKHC